MGSPTNPAVDKFGRAIAKVDYSPAGPANDVSFLFKNTVPPSNLYIMRDDQLQVNVATSQSGEFVTVNARILEPSGNIKDNQFIVAANGNRVPVSKVFALAEGYLLSLSAVANNAFTRGQTFVRVIINRGASGTGQAAQLLLADYVQTSVSAGYPGGRVLHPLEGPGNMTTAVMTNPGAGADWTISNPGNTRWRISSLNGVLTTSAVVANRDVQLQVLQSGVLVWVGQATAVIAASTAANVSAAGLPSTPTVLATDIFLPMPPALILGTNGTVRVVTANIQAADQWTNMFISVEEWLENV